MKTRLTNSIQQTFEKSLKLVTNICESDIEKIFLLKVFDYILKRPDRYSFSFILKGTDTEEINSVNVISAKANFQMPDDFGYLCGIRINNLIKSTFIEIFPQQNIEFPNPDNFSAKIKYRLDFGIYKYLISNPKEITKKYCVECDGFEFHNTKGQIKKDNKRARNLLFAHEYTTLRYLGTEIFNWDETEIGKFIWNL